MEIVSPLFIIHLNRKGGGGLGWESFNVRDGNEGMRGLREVREEETESYLGLVWTDSHLSHYLNRFRRRGRGGP